jgi:hypothetical protein
MRVFNTNGEQAFVEARLTGKPDQRVIIIVLPRDVVGPCGGIPRSCKVVPHRRTGTSAQIIVVAKSSVLQTSPRLLCQLTIRRWQVRAVPRANRAFAMPYIRASGKEYKHKQPEKQFNRFAPPFGRGNSGLTLFTSPKNGGGLTAGIVMSSAAFPNAASAAVIFWMSRHSCLRPYALGHALPDRRR